MPAAHTALNREPGSSIEFEIPGKLIFAMYWHICGPMGKARIQVDDAPPIVVDAWFDQDWGGYRAVCVAARDLKSSLQRVRVEVLEDKHPESDGHEFRILGLGAAGVSKF